MTDCFQPVAYLADLDTLDVDNIMQGYCDYRSGDPEPGRNRGRAYWHGWMNAARDHHDRPATNESAELACAFLQREKETRDG